MLYFFKDNKMPIYQKLINVNALYHQQLSPATVILNDLGSKTEQERQKLKDLVMTHYTSDMINRIPKCDCGKITGEANIGVFHNAPNCNSYVKPLFTDTVSSTVWIRRPEGLSKIISPVVWTLLNNRFSKSGFQAIQWLTNPKYQYHSKSQKIVDNLLKSGLTPGGYNYFVDNFFKIIKILFYARDFKLNKKIEVDRLLDLLVLNSGNNKLQDIEINGFIRENESCIFSDYLPMPNKIFLVVEQANMGLVYIDKTTLKPVIDAVTMMAGMDTPGPRNNVPKKELRFVQVLNRLSEYHRLHIVNNYSQKEGMFRKHVFGTRTNLSFRAVASSITKEHVYDEILPPWCVMATTFEYHITSKLLNMINLKTNRPWVLNDIVELIYSHVYKYNELLDNILKEIIAESPNDGIVCLIGRNPSLKKGSIQRVRIKDFKRDPFDKTVGISILIITAPNCDFDGDELNILILIDNYLIDMVYNLSPHFNIFEPGVPFKMSNNIALPKLVVAAAAHMLDNPDLTIDLVKLERMKLLSI